MTTSIIQDTSNQLPLHEVGEENAAYQFFRRIGSPKKIVAPMVDHSDLAYRMLCRKYNADLTFTQMFNANCFIMSEDFRQANFTTVPQDRPLFAQFAGDNPETMLKAALHVQEECDAIDVNFGCPQGIAKRGHYGAFLMEEIDLIYEIVSTLKKGLKIPVTCKTRIYKDFDRTIALLETMVRAGASMLTIHGRTREEKHALIKEADWDMLKRIKQHFHGRVPIISNGGISSLSDLHRCLEYTGVDGVMVSEAILEDPAMFCRGLDFQPGNPLHKCSPTQLDLALEYLDYCDKYPPRTFKTVRSHLLKFLYRYICIHTVFRETISVARDANELRRICNSLKMIIEDKDTDYVYTWYNRHREAPPVDEKENQAIQNVNDYDDNCIGVSNMFNDD